MARDELSEQVVKQCRVITHLAKAIAETHEDLAKVYVASDSLKTGMDEAFFRFVGGRTASIMEALGDILNGMDAVTDDDAWTDEVFKNAHRMFPKLNSEIVP